MAPSPSRQAPGVSARKADHLRAAAAPGALHRRGPGLDDVRLRHRALPGRDLADVDLTTTLLGRPLRVPLLIAAMTGGTPEATPLNDRLAAAAVEHGAGMALGSASALLDDPTLARSYRPRHRPPLLLANLGVVGLTPARATRVVELLGPDALSIHLNPIQEAVQPEGDPAFAGALERIAATVAALSPVPVVVKEVGFGLDAQDARLLAEAGVAAIDVAGAGGTNWALVEGLRDPRAGAVAEAFADWGVPTADAVREVRAAVPDVPVIASGGVGDGVAAAKCLALGAAAAAIARPLLIAAREDRATELLGAIAEQLRVATWAAGAARAVDLGPEHLR